MRGATAQSDSNKPAVAEILLPKAGGAIRVLGETFGVNAAGGAGSPSVPIAASPCRSGSGPSLNTECDASNGNGLFGAARQPGLPALTRNTEGALPRCQDAADSDAFILSGAEDPAPAAPSQGERLFKRVVAYGEQAQEAPTPEAARADAFERGTSTSRCSRP